MGNFEDLTGKKFNRLTVIERAGKDKHGNSLWLCKCDCGNEKIIKGRNLKINHTKSCGCLHSELSKERVIKINTTHNKTHTRLYTIWGGMKQRCYYPKYAEFHRYGGRGIAMCQEWKTNFQAFYDWAYANGYQEDLTIDRIDNNGNYEPDNCRWVTWEQQRKNKTTNAKVKVVINGETKFLVDVAKEYNINYYTLYTRYKNGKSLIK